MNHRWKAVIRLLIGISVILVLLIISFAVILIVPAISDPSATYIDRKGRIVAVQKTDEWKDQNAHFYDLSLHSSSGLDVDISVRIPLNTTSPRPLAIVIGGYRTGRHGIKIISESHNVIVATLSYPYHGDKKVNKDNFIKNLGHIRQAFADTPPAILNAFDYLRNQPYVDPEKIELVGVSLGAFLIGIPGALEPRIKRVWLVQGAADPAAIFEDRLTEKITFTPLRRIIAKWIEIAIGGHHVNPKKWVGLIAPRPVIAINTYGDEAFPVSSVELLHQSLREPHEVIWIKGKHVLPSRKDVIEQLASIVFRRISEDNKANTNIK